jgi:2-oxoisovalerate dehydrogenase E1 component beta subunit
MAVKTYVEAITDGLRECLKADPDVFLMGEDIGVFGGAFKVTKGLFDEFGADRVIDTPISEAGFVGAGIGAAMCGLRPVVEMQFSDFISCCFNQVVNVAGTAHYRWGGKVPLTIRCPSGGGVRGGPFHSQSPEGWFMHTPGLNVVCPATPYDAKGLLIASIRNNNPTLFFEHKWLYRRLKEDIPDGLYEVPLGKADIAREGTDVSIIAYGSCVAHSLDAAETLEQEGISVEIVDLRTLVPLDKEAVLKSVEKTSRAVVAYEDHVVAGPGSEISSILAHEGFEFLDAPVERVAGLQTPVPYAPVMEDYYLPSPKKIVDAVRRVTSF